MPKVKPGGSVSPGIRQYGTKSRYTNDELERILNDIKSGKISQREASKVYNIPRNTLRNKLSGRHTKKVGRPTVFSEEEELSFISHIASLSDEGIPISLFDVRCVVKSYLDTQNRKVVQFKLNMPGWDWSQSFLERHKAALKQRLETNSRKRAQVNEETLNEFFNNLEIEVSEVPASNIYNYDETGFHDIPQKRKVLFRRGSRHPERIRNSTKSCYTVVFCGSADGNFIPPYVIMKGTQKWSDWVYGAPKGTRLNTSKTGWIDNRVFDDWFENHFLPIAKTKLGKKILLGDNMSAHLSINALKLAAENDVRLLFFPPNSTHLLQPLDVAYFSSLKTNWRQVLSNWRETKGGKKVVALPKAVFCQLLNATLEMGKETSSKNLMKGFECSGTYPVNRNKPLQKLPMYARTTDEIRDDVGNEFKNYIESIRTNDLTVVHRARKFCLPVTAGKSVSVEEVEAFYANKETAEKQKKSGRVRGGARTRGGRAKSSSVRTLRGCQQNRGNTCSSGISGDILSNGPTPGTSSQERMTEVMLDYNDMTGSSFPAQDVENNDELESISHLVSAENDEPSDTIVVEHHSEGENISHSELAGVTTLSPHTFTVEDYVVVHYDGVLYPGQIIKIENDLFMVRCMERSGANWKWPKNDDDLWYEKTDVFKKLSPQCIIPVSNRGVFQVEDPLLGAKVLC